MKKKIIPLIGLAIIIIEIIVTTVLYSVVGDISPCTKPSFLNPFGLAGPGYCLLIEVKGAPASPFYIAADILILTVVLYMTYLLYRVLKNSKK